MLRSKLKNKCNKNRSTENWDNYKRQRNVFVKLLCNTKRNYFDNLRAPPHVKFHFGVKISISTRVEKNWCHTWVSTWGKTNIFLLHFTPGWKHICKDLRHILQKCFTEKDISCPVTGLYKNYVRFHHQEK